MFNRATLIGRLTKDPECRYTPSGVAITKFTIAVDRAYKKADQQSTDFIPVKTFGKLAEISNEYLRKGKLILIEGEMHINNYEKDGAKKSFTEVSADKMKMLDKKEV